MSTICQQGNEVCPCVQLTAIHSQPEHLHRDLCPTQFLFQLSFCHTVEDKRMLFFRSRHTLMKQLFHVQNVAPTFLPFPKLLFSKLASQQRCISAHRDKLQTWWVFLLLHSRSASILRHWLIFFNKALQNHGNGIDLCLQAANDFLGEHPGNGSTLVRTPLGELIHWKSIA